MADNSRGDNEAPAPGVRLAGRLGAKNLEARTRAVEAVLGPLIEQVTDLGSSKQLETRSGRPPTLEKLMQVVQRATQNFVTVGEQIASENSDFQADLLLACDAVKTAGESMQRAALEFSHDTLDVERREVMVAASRELLMAVTRLMVVVDAVDIQRMLRTSNRIEVKLKALYRVSSESELMRAVTDFAPDITRLTQLATHRLSEVKSMRKQQLLAAAQTQLNQASRCLITSCKTFLQYPKMASVKGNRDFVISSMTEALEAIGDLTDGLEPTAIPFLSAVEGSSGSKLYQRFDEFESLLDSSSSVETSQYPDLQDRLRAVLQSLLSEARDLLALSFTRDYRQHSIITQSSALKHKTQKLFGAFLALGSKWGREEEEEEGDGGGEREREGERGREGKGRVKLDKESVINERVKAIKKTAQDLKKELTHAVMDQFSGAFLQPLSLVERVETTALAGKEASLKKRLLSFNKHTADMEKAAKLVCSLSQDDYGTRTAQFVMKYISCLKPQVAYAAQTLCTHPQSHLAQRNIVLFREAWVENAQLLLSSVEALVPLIQFMGVVEVLVREDSQKFVQAMEGGDGREMRKTLQSVRDRSRQLLRMVKEDLAGNLEAYSASQLPSVKKSKLALEEKSLPWFANLGVKAADTLLSTHNPHTVNKSALEEAAQKVNEDLWELRRTVLLARGEWEGDIDSEVPTPGVLSPFTLSQESSLSLGGTVSPSGKFERTPCYSGVFQHSDNTQAVLAALSSGQRELLDRETESLSQEHSRFESEVHRWSDSGHDIIIIAKEMCNMMLDMSDFTKGKGQLKTTMDVIITAKDIARAGEYLYLVTKPIAEKCPNTQHRDDLLAHLDRMRLHTQQLKITSAVTAEQEEPTGDTVDTASAMLNASKSLMTSVVLVVKACYLASSAIARAEGTIPEEVVQWRLESPKQKQLTPQPPQPQEHRETDDKKVPYKEMSRTNASPSSQLEEFRAEEGGGRGGRRRVAPSPRERGSGRPRRGVGRGKLEAIPEVSPSHVLHETQTYL